MLLTRAERRLIRRRRRRHATFLLAVALLAAGWAAAQHVPPAHRRHVLASHLTPARRPRPVRSNGTPRPVLPALPGLSWASYHGIDLPVSRKEGPRHARHGLAWGFARTPGGALLAAVNIAVRTAAQWGPAIYTPTIRHQVTGPGAAALLRADAGDYATLRAAANVPRGQPAGNVYTAIAAYRIAAYDRAGATVSVVTEAPGAGSQVAMAATRVRVVWRHGDWRVVAPPGGNWAISATPLSSLAGYTGFPNQR